MTVELAGVEESLVVAPTVPSDVTNEVSATSFEHFGPIAPVIPFSDVDEAVELINDTEYGLSRSVHAGDVGTGKAITDRMDTEMTHVNDQPINDEAHVPFSGTNASGMGGYNTGDFLNEITETNWASLQHEPGEYPFYPGSRITLLNEFSSRKNGRAYKPSCSATQWSRTASTRSSSSSKTVVSATNSSHVPSGTSERVSADEASDGLAATISSNVSKSVYSLMKLSLNSSVIEIPSRPDNTSSALGRSSEASAAASTSNAGTIRTVVGDYI